MLSWFTRVTPQKKYYVSIYVSKLVIMFGIKSWFELVAFTNFFINENRLYFSSPSIYLSLFARTHTFTVWSFSLYMWYNKYTNLYEI